MIGSDISISQSEKKKKWIPLSKKEKISYSPESIKISAFYGQNSEKNEEAKIANSRWNDESKNLLLKKQTPDLFSESGVRDGVNRSGNQLRQTFEIILPNLIHKSKLALH